MKKVVVLSALALLVSSLSGCNSIDDMLSGANKNDPAPKAEAAVSEQEKKQADGYENAPDMSNAEMLGLSPDAYGPVTMETNPNAVRQNVALSDRLEDASFSNNAMLGSADPYSSVSEVQGTVEGGETLLTGYDQMPSQQIDGMSGAAMQQGNQGMLAQNQQQGMNPSQNGINPSQNGMYQQQQQNNRPYVAVEELSTNSSCSTSLNAEATGLARALIKELSARLRAESGNMYVAPTIVDREYQDCIRDLSYSIEDGLADSQTFTVVPATTNLSNIISQNIGSATILPNLIHQCRASSIPYLVVSQIKKTGGKAALTLRIIRTEDGITLSQTFRRLSE
ncbi:MAG: hypothetical protein Q4A68_05240 [Anaerobiospirillum succiniciproducens]|uniref:hypothetical protein n=1 Tax=Anaerobiospirillum succiniciproducens TaxID=13335 RepID=UPI0026DA831D|nr:hypothetical protein [Anaerobiospirillum succiniciproducens]MDO4675975.1 hypothetical protein [Anaerobiospirillum succiniciproducens]